MGADGRSGASLLETAGGGGVVCNLIHCYNEDVKFLYSRHGAKQLSKLALWSE